jgi:hypothetical protein
MEATGRRVEPHRLDDELVDLAKLGKADQLPWRPIVSLLNGLGVDPLRSLRVALDLEVLGKFLAPDRLPLAEQPLDLLEDERVALDGRRVMRFLVPDAFPDRLGLEGKRQPADPNKVDPFE